MLTTRTVEIEDSCPCFRGEVISSVRNLSIGKDNNLLLKFDGIPPFAAPMPPEEHTIKAPAILDLYSKVQRWFKKYGYVYK